ncbi:MAG: glycosyltransferase family 2 protein [Dysgonamonadaceae bacterium]|jgi:glycosyltransferase involved in cell wall biosynthesis|nr:glycosyltransferase family 2 protein [Dysgonamonadaceae bacterium]
MKIPLVSVIIPTYNRAHMLVKTLDSIVAQTYQNFEVIIVDDGSTDNTIRLLEDYKQKITRKDIAFTILKQRNAGAPVARNRGLKSAKGEYIVFFDSDDLMLPNRIEEQVRVMILENSDCCACGFLVEGEQPEERYPNIIQGKSELYAFLRRKLFGSTQSWIFKKSLILQVGGYDESLECRQDLDIVFRILITQPKISITKQLLSVFVEHNDTSRIMNKVKNRLGYDSIVKFHSKIIDYCVRNKKIELFPVAIHKYYNDVFTTLPSIQYSDSWRELWYITQRNRHYSIFNQIYLFILAFIFVFAIAIRSHQLQFQRKIFSLTMHLKKN